jgi:hypothetical protein
MRLLPCNCQFPISQQILLMNFNPCFDQLQLVIWQFPLQNISVRYRKDCVMLTVIGMNMGSFMLFIVNIP